MTRRHFIDNAPQTSLSSLVNASVTTIPVTAVTGFPTTFPYLATIDRGNASAEQVSVASAAGTNLTVTRNANGQGAFSHTAGATFEHTANAVDYDEANLHINSTSGVHGVTSNVVGINDVQTLTNKTFGNTVFAASGGVPGATFTSAADSDPVWQGKDHLGTVRASVLGSGAATFVSVSGGAGTFSTLSTSGLATLNSLSVSGNSTVNGNETVTGLLTAANITTTGTLNVSGASTVAGLTATNGTFTGTLGVTGNLTAAAGRFTNGTAVSLAGTAHPLQNGSSAGTNLAMDTTTIQARNNGAASALALNPLGGDITIGVGNVSMLTPVKNTNPGNVAAGFTVQSKVQRKMSNGKVVSLTLSLTRTGAALVSTNGNITDTLCFTLTDAATFPAELVHIQFVCIGQNNAIGTIDASGGITLRTATSDINTNDTVIGSVTYMVD